MPIINFPPTFSPDYYCEVHPELKIFNNATLSAHYEKFAVAQGLSSCPYDLRENLQEILLDVINTRRLSVLEISPWDSPFLHGETIKYFDAADAETLRKNAVDSHRPFADVPEKIHFVNAMGDLSVVDEKFDIVFSSNVIEHTPDLIAHFQAVGRLLDKGGLYIIIAPDKRYCFDHYNPVSSISEVIDAFMNNREIPTLASVINSAYTLTHNDPILHWLGYHGERFGQRKDIPFGLDLQVEVADEKFLDDGDSLHKDKFLHMIEKYAEALENNNYINTHNWRFTPDSFGYIVNILTALEFINFKLYRITHTTWGRFEFIAILEKI